MFTVRHTYVFRFQMAQATENPDSNFPLQYSEELHDRDGREEQRSRDETQGQWRESTSAAGHQ